MQQGVLPKIVYPLNGATISAASNAAAAILTVPVAPLTGSTVGISGFTSGWTSANATWIATQLSATTFSIPLNSGSFGALSGVPLAFYNLFFQRPPRMVPAYSIEATRLDNTAWSGVRESIFGRSDQYFPFDMEYVAIGGDVQSWAAFVAQAIQGVPFAYYPDYTVNSFTAYTLEDTNWVATYRHPGTYNFKMRFRQRVNWQ